MSVSEKLIESRKWFKKELVRLMFIKESDSNSIALDMIIVQFEVKISQILI